jgi:hypothetical protein
MACGNSTRVGSEFVAKTSEGEQAPSTQGQLDGWPRAEDDRGDDSGHPACEREHCGEHDWATTLVEHGRRRQEQADDDAKQAHGVCARACGYAIIRRSDVPHGTRDCGRSSAVERRPSMPNVASSNLVARFRSKALGTPHLRP